MNLVWDLKIAIQLIKEKKTIFTVDKTADGHFADFDNWINN